MTAQNRRTTIYLDTELHEVLRRKAFESARSISDLVNDAVRASFAEDAEDITAFDERVREPSVSYDEMVKRLKHDGRI